MKKLVTLLALLPLSYIANGQDTLTNPGFERWSNMGTYDVPNNWNTLNPLTNALGVITAYKATAPADVHTGANAIRLTTKNVLNTPTPALATTGTINVQQSTIDGGVPISARPVAFTGWYKYAPVNNDTAHFIITLTKWDGTNTVLVGSGEGKVSATTATYTQFSVPVNYNTADVPDTVQILLLSSSNGSAQINSTVYVDDLAYDFSTGVADVKVEGLKLYPNPSNGFATLMFNMEGAQGIDITILNTLGQNVKSIYSGKSSGGLNQVQFSTLGLPVGIYTLRLAIGTKTYTEKLVVN